MNQTLTIRFRRDLDEPAEFTVGNIRGVSSQRNLTAALSALSTTLFAVSTEVAELVAAHTVGGWVPVAQQADFRASGNRSWIEVVLEFALGPPQLELSDA